MKLYFSPGACALSPQILLRETEQKFELVKVDLKTKQSSEGNYLTVNPKGYVPALKLDNGEVLTEGAVIAQYISDLRPERKLLPAFGTFARYRALEWLNFISSELHKGFSPLFTPNASDETKKSAEENLHQKFEFVDQHLAKNQYLLGTEFSAPDAYLFNILQWPAFVKVDISRHRHIGAFLERVAARPSVKAALEAERAGKRD